MLLHVVNVREQLPASGAFIGSGVGLRQRRVEFRDPAAAPWHLVPSQRLSHVSRERDVTATSGGGSNTSGRRSDHDFCLRCPLS